MELFLVKLLCFLAVFSLITGIAAIFKKGEPEKPSESAEKPPLFKAFKNEFETIGALLEPTVNRAFPEDAEKVKNDLIVATLSDRLTVRDMRGAQGMAAVTFFIIGGVGVFLFNSNVGYAIASAILL